MVAPSSVLFGPRHHGADLLDPVEHGAEALEGGVECVGEAARKRRLAAAGRAPKQQASGLARTGNLRQHTFGAEQMALADDLLERAGAHPVGEWG